jgi:FkbM family methyltransferase
MRAIPNSLYGIEFFTEEGEPSDFGMFQEGNPAATDTGPMGMVQEMKAFIRITEPLRNLVDAGALFGVFSLVFTRHRDATAYAIEPSGLAFDGLLANVHANPDRSIVPIKKLAGELTGDLVECGPEWKHIVTNRFPDGRKGWYKATAIDDMEIPSCDCIKVDVEGFEVQTLRGARKTIAGFRPIIFLECHFSVLGVNGESPASLFNLIRDMRYRVEDYQGNVLTDFEGRNGARVLCVPQEAKII